MLFTSGCNHPSFSLPWRTLLAHLVALHLLHQGSAQFRVVAPDLRVTANVGQDVVLRCHLSPCKNAWSSDIRWIQHRSSGLVHHYQDGEDLEQMEEYKGRTELLGDGLSDGNLDLRITAVSSSDSGSYICAVLDGDGYAEAVVNLEVSDPFSQITHPWNVALAVVITLLVASTVINVFLYRKQVAQSRMLKRKDAALAEQAERLRRKDAALAEQAETLENLVAELKQRDAALVEQAAQLVEHAEDVENLKSQLKKHSDEIEQWDATLEQQAAELEQRDAALEQQAEELDLRAADLTKQVGKLGSSATHLKIQAAKFSIHFEKKDLRAADLNKLAANLVEQTEEVAQRSEAVEKQNSRMRKQYEEMDLSTADLKIIAGKLDLRAADLQKHVAELEKRAEAVEKGNSVLKEHYKDMEIPPEGSDREMDCSSQ